MIQWLLWGMAERARTVQPGWKRAHEDFINVCKYLKREYMTEPYSFRWWKLTGPEAVTQAEIKESLSEHQEILFRCDSALSTQRLLREGMTSPSSEEPALGEGEVQRSLAALIMPGNYLLSVTDFMGNRIKILLWTYFELIPTGPCNKNRWRNKKMQSQNLQQNLCICPA